MNRKCHDLTSRHYRKAQKGDVRCAKCVFADCIRQPSGRLGRYCAMALTETTGHPCVCASNTCDLAREVAK